MEKGEKIKKIYQKYDVNIGEDYLDGIINNPQRTNNLIKMYEDEEINSMNEIFYKDENNKYFTKEELEFVSDMDLFDPYTIKVAKEIWKVKDNNKLLETYLKILEKECKEKKILKEREVIA